MSPSGMKASGSGEAFWMRSISQPSSSVKPMPKMTSASATRAMSRAPGLNVCGSTFRGTSAVRFILSPPTFAAQSATMAVVVMTSSRSGTAVGAGVGMGNGVGAAGALVAAGTGAAWAGALVAAGAGVAGIAAAAATDVGAAGATLVAAATGVAGVAGSPPPPQAPISASADAMMKASINLDFGKITEIRSFWDDNAPPSPSPRARKANAGARDGRDRRVCAY